MDHEDFRRLGVRTNESRLAVIRMAAARSAKALAEEQLSSPSEQVALQLSRIATSAYRLLDPRRRPDPTQRAHVGRILPNTLNLAAQTEFYSGSDAHPANAPFTRNAADDVALNELLESDVLETAHVESQDWAANLTDHGAASRTRPRKSHRAFPWGTIVVVGIVIGTVLGLVRIQQARRARSGLSPVAPPSRPQELPTDPSAVVVPQGRPIDERADSPERFESSEGAGSTESVGSTESTESFERDRRLESTDDSLLDPPSVGRDSPNADVGPASVIGEPMVKHEETVAGLVEDPSPRFEEDTADNREPNPFATRDRSPVPPTADELSVPEIEPIRPNPMAPTVGPPENPIKRMLERQSPPDAAAIRAARKRWLKLLPSLAKRVPPRDIPQRIGDIEDLLPQSNVGSADHWVGQMMIAELAWRIETPDQVRDRLERLPQVYDVALPQPLAESLIGACDAATAPETYQHLVEQSFHVADYLLTHQSMEQCRRLMRAIGPLVDELQSDASRATARRFTQACDQMQRLYESSSRMIDDSGNVDESRDDLGILGRYNCLMLRNWADGLQWLTKASDPRIASVARQEVALEEGASSDDRIDLAERWLVVASRTAGRASESMRLHAIEILRGVSTSTSGLRKLEVERGIEEAISDLPPYLRDPVLTSGDEAGRGESLPGERANSSTAKPGLSGRILVGGKDIGVQIDYELDVPITQTMLDTIAARMNRPLAQVSLRFEGEFEIAEPSSVYVSIAQMDGNDATEAVSVDGEPIDRKSLVGTAEVILAPGVHRIVWTIETSGIESRAFLRLRDARSRQRIAVSQPSYATQIPTRLTVAMVRGG